MIKKLLALFKSKPVKIETPSTSYKVAVEGFHGSAKMKEHGHFAKSFGNVFRSGQPLYNSLTLKVLKANNIKLIINLRRETRMGSLNEQVKIAQTLGIKFMHFPLDTAVNLDLNINNAQRTLNTLNFLKHYLISKPNDGVLIHCLHGEDRTGIFIKLLREMLGESEENAAKEFRSFGGTLYPALHDLYKNVKAIMRD